MRHQTSARGNAKKPTSLIMQRAPDEDMTCVEKILPSCFRRFASARASSQQDLVAAFISSSLRNQPIKAL